MKKLIILSSIIVYCMTFFGQTTFTSTTGNMDFITQTKKRLILETDGSYNFHYLNNNTVSLFNINPMGGLTLKNSSDIKTFYMSANGTLKIFNGSTGNQVFGIDLDGSSYTLGNAMINNLSLGSSNSTTNKGSHIAFNSVLNFDNTWTFKGDGTNNGGAVIKGGVNGDITFYSKPSYGISDNVYSQGTLDFSLTAMRITTTPSVNGSSDLFTLVMGGSSVTNSIIQKYDIVSPRGILASKIKCAVQGTANWSDYVFASDYKLKPLEEVEMYVLENKHLPGVPSAEEMVESGLDVVATDAMLLEKIEELTLYMIELKKQNQNLQRQINEISKSKL